MIKKRYTYAFFDFVFTKYKKNDDVRLCKLFDQMSIQEKADILRLDFDRLWARIRIKIPIQPKSDTYVNEYNKKSKKDQCNKDKCNKDKCNKDKCNKDKCNKDK